MLRSATSSALALAALATSALLGGAPAGAVSRVWVSHLGSDGNPCTAASPCATFQHAHNVVAAAGEISVLDPGDYGLVTITKAVSITNDGAGEAGILNTGSLAAAVTVNAAGGDVVSLRGLVLEGAGTGGFGIVANSVGGLHVQNCVVRNFEGPLSIGIVMIANTGASKLFVSDSLVYNNGSAPNTGGIFVQAQGGSINALLNRVQMEDNVLGLKVSSTSAGSNVHLTLRDSTLVGNAGDGVLAAVSGGSGAFVFVERTTAVNNAGSGLHADGAHAVILLSDSSVTNNGSGVSTTNGGQLISYVNNGNNNNVGPEGTATGTNPLF